MTVEELLIALWQADVTLWCDGGDLRYRSPKGVLTAVLQNQLRAYKAEILNYLADDAYYSRPSFAQERLWFLSQFIGEENPVYHIAGALRLQGNLKIDVLNRSLNEILRRHDVLRSTFVTVAGQPIQRTCPVLSTTLPVTDLQGKIENGDLDLISRLAEEARQPFQLASGPLFRLTLFRLSPKEHVLLLVMHHIISDGYSLGIFMRELVALYRAYHQDRPSPLPELSLQYPEYARWQRRWQAEVIETQHAYWRKQLANLPPALDLPGDYGRSTQPSYRGATHRFSLPQSVAARLKTYSQEMNVTLFTALLTAFQLFLFRLTGQTDLTIGLPVANRTRSELTSLIGLFVNTLVLRVDFHDAPSFQESVQRIHQITLAAYAHQDLPFEKLVELLNPTRHLDQTPFFQVMMVQQLPLMSDETLPELKMRLMPVDTGTANFDLTLFVEETGEGIDAIFEYSTDLFCEATIKRWGQHFQVLLERMLSDPKRPVTAFTLLTDEQQQEMLVDWNDTRTSYPHDQLIHQWFAAQAEKTPRDTAVIYDGHTLDYQTLDQRSNQLAHYLQKMGVVADVRVCLCVERSLEMIIGIIGILKAGGAYVPLDPTYPQERLAFMLQDAGASLLLTQAHLVNPLPDYYCQTICLDRDWELIAAEAITSPEIQLTAQHLAYLIYTSGSTGQPKGVAVTHKNLVHSTYARTLTYEEPVQRFLLLSSFAFDSSVAGIFWTLCQGGTLVIPYEGDQQDAYLLIELIAQYEITHLLCLPALYASLLENAFPLQLASLRTVIVAGEPCPASLVERHRRALPTTVLYNEYGPTEATVWSTAVNCSVVGSAQASTVPIGRPIPNVQAYVVDEHLQPVPVGVPGELLIGGEGIARGYWQRPRLTAQKFMANPFLKGENNVSSRPILFRTGDRVSYSTNGQLTFLGRVDRQVKLRGYRIELEEIEAVLTQHTAVQETAVIIQGDTPDSKRLVAYVVPQTDTPLSVTDLRPFLKQHLPDHMIPTTYMILTALPRTLNGKVDHHQLPISDTAQRTNDVDYCAPRNPIETILADIWHEVLGVTQIGVHDNFFELGGHSLLATKMMSRIRDTFRVEPTLRDLFEFPTIAELAVLIAQHLAQYLEE